MGRRGACARLILTGPPQAAPQRPLGLRGIGMAVLALGLAGAGCLRARDEAKGWRWHRVAAGETLGGIAARYHIPQDDLAEANALADPDRIQEGELLYIPMGGDLRVRATTGPHPRREPVTLGPKPAPLGVVTDEGEAPLSWPVHAAISSRFGLREGKPHQGIDLMVADGTEVRAAAAGRVLYAGGGLRGYGNLVMLRHENGLTTIYAHNSTLLVVEGTPVARGEVISLSGHSGRTTAPHLHFEVRDGDVPRDPELYLQKGP
ncbi:MAG: M23 family metallopeptidase [Myxococcales bacterium]|nr:M23 family metallopeptidase [Myxococcales bacterium]